MLTQKLHLNNNQLKIIAMVSMLFDHIGRELLPDFSFLTLIGRLSFPIFAFMIAEGAFHTRNKLKYLRNIGILGLGCQLVYFFTTKSLYQNVLITFSLSIITIIISENFKNKKDFKSLSILISEFTFLVFICVFLPKIITDFQIDYGIFGVLMPVGIYFANNKKEKIVLAIFFIILLFIDYRSQQWFAIFSVPLIMLYNGNRGKMNLKYIFYIFYPLHLAVIYLINLVI